MFLFGYSERLLEWQSIAAARAETDVPSTHGLEFRAELSLRSDDPAVDLECDDVLIMFRPCTSDHELAAGMRS